MKTEEKKLLDSFMEKCRENNLKITPQRTAIYKELLDSEDHPNSDSVFKKVRDILPNISFDTVNRTLLTFSKIGIVDVVEGHGEPKRFDPQVDSHHHFRCLQCSVIYDIFSDSLDNIGIPVEIDRRFTVLNKKVVLEGICDKCKDV